MELFSVELESTAHLVVWRTWRGRLQLILPLVGPDVNRWTTQNCSLAEALTPVWMTATGCGAEQPLSRDPG